MVGSESVYYKNRGKRTELRLAGPGRPPRRCGGGLQPAPEAGAWTRPARSPRTTPFSSTRDTPMLAANASADVVGRGHVSLLNNVDTWQCKPFRGIGHLTEWQHGRRLRAPSCAPRSARVSGSRASASSGSARSRPSHGRVCHSTLSLTAIGCHSLGIYTVVLLPLLSFLSK